MRSFLVALLFAFSLSAFADPIVLTPQECVDVAQAMSTYQTLRQHEHANPDLNMQSILQEMTPNGRIVTLWILANGQIDSDVSPLDVFQVLVETCYQSQGRTLIDNTSTEI